MLVASIIALMKMETVGTSETSLDVSTLQDATSQTTDIPNVAVAKADTTGNQRL
jgi:hypothetical protein